MKTSMLVAAVVLAGVTALAQETGVREVATVQELMNDLIVPSSNAVFGGVGLPPEGDDEAGWDALAREARILAEAGNLLMVGERAGNGDEWLTAARAQVEAAVTALDAIVARDPEALAPTADAILAACTACHASYL